MKTEIVAEQASATTFAEWCANAAGSDDASRGVVVSAPKEQSTIIGDLGEVTQETRRGGSTSHRPFARPGKFDPGRRRTKVGG